MADQFGAALAPLSERDLMIVKLGVRRKKNHPSGILAIFDQAENVAIKSDHLVEVVDVEHDMANPFDL